MNIFYCKAQKEDSFRFLKRVFADFYGTEVKESDLIRNEYGKPEIINCDVKFNISHSGDIIVLAADKNEIGVDVEKIKTRDYKRIADRYFTEKVEDLEDFYRLWTKKESFVKYMGSSVFIALKSTVIGEDGCVWYEGKKSKVKLFTMYLGDDYIFSVCGESGEIYLFSIESL